MVFVRRTSLFRAAARFALLAMLVQALALATHRGGLAMAANDGNGLVVALCTPQGVVHVRLGEDGRPLPSDQQVPDGGTGSTPCPVCLAYAGLAMAAAVETAALAAPPRSPLARPGVAPDKIGVRTASARIRGPPVITPLTGTA